jgi:hypothetical protein
VANALLTPKVFANASLAVLKNKIVAAKKINGKFTKEFKQVGDTVTVKRPPQFLIRNGPVVAIQDVIEGETAVKIDRQSGIDIQFNSLEETLSVDALLKSRTLNSAMGKLAQDVDSNIHGLYAEFNNWVGTPGQVVNSASDFLLAPKRLDNLAVPTDDRFALLSPNDHYGLVSNFTGLYAQRGTAENALEKAGAARHRRRDPVHEPERGQPRQRLARGQCGHDRRRQPDLGLHGGEGGHAPDPGAGRRGRERHHQARRRVQHRGRDGGQSADDADPGLPAAVHGSGQRHRGRGGGRPRSRSIRRS